MVIFLNNNYPPGFYKINIHILTNDNDYLQVMYNNVNIINLDNKDLKICSLGSPEIDLFVKILLGDKSDNISKVFERLGEKLAIKIYETPGLLNQYFEKYPGTE
jgi:5'-3' exonuclease